MVNRERNHAIMADVVTMNRNMAASMSIKVETGADIMANMTHIATTVVEVSIGLTGTTVIMKAKAMAKADITVTMKAVDIILMASMKVLTAMGDIIMVVVSVPLMLVWLLR